MQLKSIGGIGKLIFLEGVICKMVQKESFFFIIVINNLFPWLKGNTKFRSSTFQITRLKGTYQSFELVYCLYDNKEGGQI